jgi:uncharacterized protein (TIGR02453 family)
VAGSSPCDTYAFSPVKNIYSPLVSPSTLSFLRSLKKNNNKPWFEKNRDKYISAKNEFGQFVEGLLKKMILFEEEVKDLEAKNCTFRINRDIRFSKNKTPYKVSLSASFSRGGKKSIFADYYFHLQPGEHSYSGGGLWMPEPADLKKLQQEIDYCFPEFEKILGAPAFKKQFGTLYKDAGQMLVNVPKGYEKDNPAADFLKMKSFVAIKNIPDADLPGPGLTGEVIRSFRALMPLVKFMNQALE